MSKLFFDTETTGLPNMKLPVSHPSQPRICQLAAILTDEKGITKAELNFLVKPEGWEIPKDCAEIHGIDTLMAQQYGIAMKPLLMLFHRLLQKATLNIAHNIKFDNFLLQREIIAAGFRVEDFSGKSHCTMEQATPILQLPPSERMAKAGMKGFKGPKLSEAYKYFTGKELEGAHDAMVDVRACKDIFFAMNPI